MKQLSLIILFLTCLSLSLKAQSSAETFTISKKDILANLEADRFSLDAFTTELEALRSRQLKQADIQSISARQDELNARVRGYLVLYDYIPDMPDEIRRTHNQAMTISGQNAGRVKDLISSDSGNNNQGSAWLISWIKTIVIAQFPYLETVINLFLK